MRQLFLCDSRFSGAAQSSGELLALRRTCSAHAVYRSRSRLLEPAAICTGLRGFDLRRWQVTMLRTQAQGVPAVQRDLASRLAGHVCLSAGHSRR